MQKKHNFRFTGGATPPEKNILFVFYLRRYIALTIIIPPSSRCRSKPPPLQSKGVFKKVKCATNEQIKNKASQSAMFKQKNQPCFTIHLIQKIFAYFFQKSVVPTFCLSRRIDFDLAIHLTQKFFAYFFSKK